MTHKIYVYQDSNEKLIEKVIDDQNIHLNHVILTQNDKLPEHYSNSNVYLIINKGIMTIQLDDEVPQIIENHHFIYISHNTKMNISNQNHDLLEFFIVKSPNPENINKEC